MVVLCLHKYFFLFCLTLTNSCIYTFLEPYNQYTVQVFARTENNIKSSSSRKVVQVTEVDGPSPPIIVNATCTLNTSRPSIFLQWTRPEYFNKSVDEYKLSIFTDDNNLIQSTVIKNDDNYVCQK